MIVLTYVSNYSRHVLPGDEFHMTVTDGTGTDVVVREVITVAKKIDFMAAYRFALEDGTCPSFPLCGIFGNRRELPKEIKEAVRLEDLTEQQYNNFIAIIYSC